LVYVLITYLNTKSQFSFAAVIRCSYGGMHIFIDGGNIGTELSHFLLGLYEIRLQGIEVSFQVLVTGMGHDDDGTEKGLVE
jgi:hypothetical protein